ncbi:GDP-mannose 4,6-dehydratase [Diaminobutyricimonas sp. TR449]|uniref:GDP-mannose 4,6-dehydratase n=1 Tax=Diaminobutyricimonas sp. TR449 TaxID=2708076 RepID=UPI00142296DD|nr:GDP-mannose 4,6-dehydratase [Diaminobutyricimonas sp. TR449]
MPVALVTGVTGQDGSYLAEQLLGEGWEVHALVREGRHESAPADQVVVHRGDLSDVDRLAEVVRESAPDTVFNLAGISSVAYSWQHPAETAALTGVAATALLEAAWQLQEVRGSSVRFVQASSSEIFGAAVDQPQTEATPIAPASPYGAAKAFAHHMVGLYRSRGLFASNAILYNHESLRRPEAFVTRKITMGVAAVAAGRQKTISLGNLDAQRDWGWAPDYVEALRLIGAADAPDDFIVATGETHSVRDFVRVAFQAVGIDDWEARVELDPRFARPNDSAVMRGDSSKLRTELGWAPRHDFESIVSDMVRHDLTLLQG